MLMKTKPKYVAECWKWFTQDYRNDIENGSIQFFIDMDYSYHLKNTPHSEWFLKEIDKFREPVSMMNSKEKQHTMEYIINLTKLADMI